MSGGVADQDYFLDGNGELTTDENESAFLLIRKGQDVPNDVAEKYGIGKVAQDEPEVKADAPSKNKKATPSKNKGVK